MGLNRENGCGHEDGSECHEIVLGYDCGRGDGSNNEEVRRLKS